ncbi:lipopolysaccharide kinase InaA family protein [Fuchsiella alkaliacetigena]|uniref:lipopolysaccharide kinase InaA family protein n=1 Tax=Fuchsiella alkaliacetigena TaxID=957042 RepID=UPI00200A5701|nr:lipopolysaccharide kinase InaA family protein [Fuchsiella alkaliacetigena]MCK8824297.1 lipopolysaccharide kinase InaA family protein [Fuchsiella alkaliacetigena]
MKEVIDKVDYYKEKTEKGYKLLWIDDDWDGDNFRDFLYSLKEKVDSGIRIHDKRNLLVKIDKEEGLQADIAVKKFRLTRKYDKIRFCFIDSKAVRSLRIAFALQKIGLKTPQPIAVIEERGKFNQLIYSYYVTEYVDYDYSLRDVVENKVNYSSQQFEKLLSELAKELYEMHEQGIIHNDLHVGNILVKDLDDSFSFYYIDLNRARIKDKLSKKQRIKDLARLRLTEEEQKLLLKDYIPAKYKEWLPCIKAKREKRNKFRKYKKKIKGFFNLNS